MEGTTTRYPEYVTDGSHIYVWHEEYESLLNQGKLKASPPPSPKVLKQMTPRQQTKLEAARRKALQDAETAVELLKVPVTQTKLEDVFGAPPKEE